MIPAVAGYSLTRLLVALAPVRSPDGLVNQPQLGPVMVPEIFFYKKTPPPGPSCPPEVDFPPGHTDAHR